MGARAISDGEGAGVGVNPTQGAMRPRAWRDRRSFPRISPDSEWELDALASSVGHTRTGSINVIHSGAGALPSSA